MVSLSDTQSAPQAHHIQLEDLGTVTSMEELLSRFEGKNPDWSAIRDKLVALDKRELAEKVYREYIWPKLGKLDTHYWILYSFIL